PAARRGQAQERLVRDGGISAAERVPGKAEFRLPGEGALRIMALPLHPGLCGLLVLARGLGRLDRGEGGVILEGSFSQAAFRLAELVLGFGIPPEPEADLAGQEPRRGLLVVRPALDGALGDLERSLQ